jgi:hypothetical protein
MKSNTTYNQKNSWPTLSTFPIPAKALVTAIIVILSIAMTGALGQIIIHDIIPTFFVGSHPEGHMGYEEPEANPTTVEDQSRGDLFAEEALETESEEAAFHTTEQFVWTLKWTHIHLFGMNMIFFFVGAITVFLNYGVRLKTWLIVLPFIGVLVDIAAMWLKGYVSPFFFWLHIPGGGLFGLVFFWVSLRALGEMWLRTSNFRSRH